MNTAVNRPRSTEHVVDLFGDHFPRFDVIKENPEFSINAGVDISESRKERPQFRFRCRVCIVPVFFEICPLLRHERFNDGDGVLVVTHRSFLYVLC